MINPEEAAAQKRKASPSPPVEDGGSKRPKIDATPERESEPIENAQHDQGGDRPYNNDSTVAPKSDAQPAAAEPRRSRESGEHERPTGEQRPDPPTGRMSATPSSRAEEGDTAARLSAEARRPLLPLAGSRKAFSQEEKKRGQRLFGGLLSTLSQTTSSSQQKKRLELERRQQERARQQRAEDDRRRADKLAKLEHTRKIEQVEFDEQAMHTRHANMLALARCLRTRSEPRLYYRPWKLTEGQERTIQDQIRAAQETMDREVEDFEDQKVQRLRDLGVLRPPSRQHNVVAEPKPPEDTNRQWSVSSSNKMQIFDKVSRGKVVPEMQLLDKIEGEEVVHDEDTVIF